MRKRAVKKTTQATVGSPVPQAKIDRMLHRIREAYRLGREINESPDKQAKIDELMQEYGLSESTVRKWRLFNQEYSQQELEKLCDLLRPNGLPLHRGYLPFLLTIASRTKRAEIQAEAARKGWTEPMLRAVIKKRKIGNPKPRGGGRPRKEPEASVARLRFRLTQAESYWDLCGQTCRELVEMGVGPNTARQLLKRLDRALGRLTEMRDVIVSATR